MPVRRAYRGSEIAVPRTIRVYNRTMTLDVRLRALLWAAVASAVVLYPTSLVLAHSSGVSWSARDGEYTIDVGYEPESFVEGRHTRFDFLLWEGEADTGTPAPFSHVWVRITDTGGNTFVAGGIWKQLYGPTTLIFVFPSPGSYLLEASYRDEEGNDIAVATFPVSVERAAASGVLSGRLGVFLSGLLVGALGGLVVSLVSARSRRRY